MAIMKKQIEVEAYTDNEGNPTCSSSYQKRETCVFYRIQRHGVEETCVFSEKEGGYFKPIVRNNGGLGHLQPHDQCPIWGKK